MASDLAALINEAAILAAMKGKEAVDTGDLEEARDRVKWGREKLAVARAIFLMSIWGSIFTLRAWTLRMSSRPCFLSSSFSSGTNVR